MYGTSKYPAVKHVFGSMPCGKSKLVLGGLIRDCGTSMIRDEIILTGIVVRA